MITKQIKHPYITINKKIRGGAPVISGTGIRVLDIAIRYEIMGQSPEDIMVVLPQINLPQIHDALSYYYEHKNEIDSIWKAAIQETEDIKKLRSSILEKKLGKIKDIH
ncbi:MULTISPECIES: DUF433 domain-containing protein [Kuenenia]|nr:MULTISPECIES: DUF433 domain-containing protein [Kuenenia]MCZ7621643.1 DUF433 domain-containing protein [Candidatus Kuenenia sp.]